MKKKIIISVSIVAIILLIFVVAFIVIQSKAKAEAKAIAAVDTSLDTWITNNLSSSDNYTITLEIPEAATGNRWINLDSLATLPFWSWLDTRLYEGNSTLTIKVSRIDKTASFDDGTEVYFLSAKGDLTTYFPTGNDRYDRHLLEKQLGLGGKIRGVLFLGNENLFKSIEIPKDTSISDGHIKATRKIDSRPFLSAFVGKSEKLPTRPSIKVSMDASVSPEQTLTMRCNFARLLSDISALLYNESMPKDNAEIGDYHLNITIDKINQTEPIVLPTNINGQMNQ